MKKVLWLIWVLGVSLFAQSNDASPPDRTVKLVFIHHSVGNNWLSKNHGNLGALLGQNNYCVHDTYYGWDALYNTDIGSHTDIGEWYWWFIDSIIQDNGVAKYKNILKSVFETGNHNAYYDMIADPGGENEIIMFKSCYPNSDIRDDNQYGFDDFCGKTAYSSTHTLGNVKEMYRRVLSTLKKFPQKMFVIITAPPMVEGRISCTNATNARTFNNWLVNDWLKEAAWENKNVYVYDFFNVLTNESNHHWYYNNTIRHEIAVQSNFSAYGASDADSHPNVAGSQKAAGEFVPVLNVYYHRFQEFLYGILQLEEKTQSLQRGFIINSFPNPFNPIVQIKTVGMGGTGKIYIYNINGQLVKEDQYNSDRLYQWSAPGHPSGIYIVKIVINGVVAQAKVLLLK